MLEELALRDDYVVILKLLPLSPSLSLLLPFLSF